MNKYSKIYTAFIETYGEIGQSYDEDTWMERLGVFVCGWLACQKATGQANVADLPHLGPLMEGASSAAPKPVTSSAKLQSAHLRVLGGYQGGSMDISDECKLCGGVVEKTRPYCLLGEHIFHVDCYETVLKRLNIFWEVLTLPDEQWQDWMDDDSQ